MKNSHVIAPLLLLIAACATTPPNIAGQPNPTQLQVTFTQACVGYQTAFATALDLRIQNKLSAAEINQITTLDANIEPICATPVVPSNVQIQIQTVQSAFDALTAINKGK